MDFQNVSLLIADAITSAVDNEELSCKMTFGVKEVEESVLTEALSNFNFKSATFEVVDGQYLIDVKWEG